MLRIIFQIALRNEYYQLLWFAKHSHSHACMHTNKSNTRAKCCAYPSTITHTIKKHRELLGKICMEGTIAFV